MIGGRDKEPGFEPPTATNLPAGLTTSNSKQLKLGLGGALGGQNAQNQGKQLSFRAETYGYLIRQVTTADGHSINPPERLAPVVRNQVQYKRAMEFGNHSKAIIDEPQASTFGRQLSEVEKIKPISAMGTPKSVSNFSGPKLSEETRQNKTPIIIFRHVPDHVITRAVADNPKSEALRRVLEVGFLLTPDELSYCCSSGTIIKSKLVAYLQLRS